MRFFMKLLKFAFMYKRYDTLRYVMFYKKRQTLRKKKDNLRYVFIFKKSGHFALRDFHRVFEIGQGEGVFLYEKTIQFA